jgi:hypothetical protein
MDKRNDLGSGQNPKNSLSESASPIKAGEVSSEVGRKPVASGSVTSIDQIGVAKTIGPAAPEYTSAQGENSPAQPQTNSASPRQETADPDAVSSALCDLCRPQGRCMLGFPASWRYLTTQIDPFLKVRRTKMDELTVPMEANKFKPPVLAFGDGGVRYIVGVSACAYVRSLELKPRRKMDAKVKNGRRKAKSSRNPAKLAGPAYPPVPPPKSLSVPAPPSASSPAVSIPKPPPPQGT